MTVKAATKSPIAAPQSSQLIAPTCCRSGADSCQHFLGKDSSTSPVNTTVFCNTGAGSGKPEKVSIVKAKECGNGRKEAVKPPSS